MTEGARDFLPAWAIEPLSMAQAARALGICRRSLTDLADRLFAHGWDFNRPGTAPDERLRIVG